MITDELSSKYIKKLIEDNLRADGRSFDQFREIKVETGVLKTAEGSAKVTIGETVVLAGIKMSIGVPFPDSPEEGVLIVSAEFIPLASPTFEPGPPNENSIEASRVVDRGLRESKCIDLSKLCITPKEKVWIVNVDVDILDHDGNLIDAISLAALAALLDAKIPRIQDDKPVPGEYTHPLPISDKPIEVTVSKISGKLLVDLNFEEESGLESRVTFSINESDNICAIQKGGKGFFTSEELLQAFDLALVKSKELRILLP